MVNQGQVDRENFKFQVRYFDVDLNGAGQAAEAQEAQPEAPQDDNAAAQVPQEQPKPDENKDAVVVALAERELDAEREEILALLGAAPVREGLSSLLRRFVETVVSFHAKRPALPRILFEEASHPPESHACVLRFEESLAHALETILRRQHLEVRDPDVAAHLVVQTTESLAHRFILRGIHDLDRKAFVTELTRLLERYLGRR